MVFSYSKLFEHRSIPCTSIIEFVQCYTKGMNHKLPLAVYVIGVIVAWAIVLCVAWFVGGQADVRTFGFVCAGFLLGMLAMYIAVHLYRRN